MHPYIPTLSKTYAENSCIKVGVNILMPLRSGNRLVVVVVYLKVGIKNSHKSLVKFCSEIRIDIFNWFDRCFKKGNFLCIG